MEIHLDVILETDDEIDLYESKNGRTTKMTAAQEFTVKAALASVRDVLEQNLGDGIKAVFVGVKPPCPPA